MKESIGYNSNRSVNFLRSIVGLLLPSLEKDFNRLPLAEVAEYTGPRYDDPVQIAQMKARLSEIEFQRVNDSIDLIV